MVYPLDQKTFTQKIHNLGQNRPWKFKSKKPCVIEFKAEWCGPCKPLSASIDELSENYANQLNFYRVDAEKETILSSAFDIKNIPTLVFCSPNKLPKIVTGSIDKAEISRIIKEYLNI